MYRSPLTLLVILSEIFAESAKKDSSWLESVLGKSRMGVFHPDFEEENNTKIILRDGETAVFDCKVYMLKDKTVSWLRRTESGAELLTVGDSTYTGDVRITAVPTYPNNWRLNISDVRPSDAGTYLCEISTHPPTVLHKLLEVKAAIVEILSDMNADSINPVYGVEDKFYNPGSDIQLSCVIRRVSGGTVWLKVHTNIMWIKDGNVIDLHKRHSVSVGTQVEAEKIISTLLVKEAMLSDSGKYSCSLPHLASSYFPRAAVMVHVIQGDHQAVYGAASLTNSSRFIYLLYGYLLCCRRQFLMNA